MVTELMKVQEVAKQLNVSEGAVRTWILRREIPYVKIGASVRIKKSDLSEWVESKTNPAICRI